MKPLVFNSTPLIYITKTGLSNIFETLNDEKLTSLQVKKKLLMRESLRAFLTP